MLKFAMNLLGFRSVRDLEIQLQETQEALSNVTDQLDEVELALARALKELASRDAGMQNAIRTLKTLDYFALSTEEDIRSWLSGKHKELNDRLLH